VLAFDLMRNKGWMELKLVERRWDIRILCLCPPSSMSLVTLTTNFNYVFLESLSMPYHIPFSRSALISVQGDSTTSEKDKRSPFLEETQRVILDVILLIFKQPQAEQNSRSYLWVIKISIHFTPTKQAYYLYK
jgi:hypothetical protein